MSLGVLGFSALILCAISKFKVFTASMSGCDTGRSNQEIATGGIGASVAIPPILPVARGTGSRARIKMRR
jgi:hypothetical protein